VTESVASAWREAVSIFEQDRDAAVPCPTCQVANLRAKDSTGYREAGTLLVDRYLSCPSCGARRAIERVRV
jgi:hypothetical protein